MTDQEREALTQRANDILQRWEEGEYDNAREAWSDVDEVLEQRQYLDRELVQRLDAVQNEAARIVAEVDLE